MEILNLVRLFWGWGFPYISHFEYLKCLVIKRDPVINQPVFHAKSRAVFFFFVAQIRCLSWEFFNAPSHYPMKSNELIPKSCCLEMGYLCRFAGL